MALGKAMGMMVRNHIWIPFVSLEQYNTGQLLDLISFVDQVVEEMRMLGRGVGVHVVLASESLAAEQANERPLASVQPDVLPDVGRDGRLVAADAAEGDRGSNAAEHAFPNHGPRAPQRDRLSEQQQ